MADIFDVLNSVELQDYVQNREYPLTVGDNLFPQTKTEDFEIEYILGSNNAPVSASVHAFDSEAQVGSREGFGTMRMGLAMIKRKIQMNERLIIALNRARNDQETQQVINRIFDDVDNMVNSVRTRIEAMRFEALSTGRLEINENGYVGTIDYRVPEENRETLGGTDVWTDAGADPLSDIDRFVDNIVATTGVTPSRILTSRRVLNTLKRHDAVRTGIFGGEGARLVGNDELNTFLQGQGLPAIATDDRVYRVQLNDGTYATRRFFPENALVVMPDGALGQTVYGVTPEEIELRNTTNNQLQDFGNIIAQIYSTPDPVARWTKAVARALPSFPAANQVYIANVLGDEVDGSVGTGDGGVVEG